MTPVALATEEQRKLDLYQCESDKMAVYRDKQQQEAIARHEVIEKEKKKDDAATAAKRKEEDEARVKEMTSMAARQSANASLMSSASISGPLHQILTHYGGNKNITFLF